MSFILQYEELARRIVAICPGPDKFAHTYLGLAIWLIAAIALGRPLRSWQPLLVAIVFECANEVVDRLAHGDWMWHDTWRDMLASWFWPVVLFVALNLEVRRAASRIIITGELMAVPDQVRHPNGGQAGADETAVT